MSIKKKILAGILSGAMIFGVGTSFNSVYAEPPAPEQEQQQEFDGKGHRPNRPQMTEEQINEYAKEIADYYGLDQAEISTAIKNHVHFEDIRQAATLAKLSNKSFSEVLAMKVDWRQVAEKLGVSREQYEAFRKDEMLAGLAEHAKLDKKTVENLLNENYNPHDITIAGIIANASGKNVKAVFAKRTINNTWDDVAKSFGVDLHKLMKPDGDKHGDKDSGRHRNREQRNAE